MTVHIRTMIPDVAYSMATAVVAYIGKACDCEGCGSHRICNSREMAWILPRPKLRAATVEDSRLLWTNLPRREHGGLISLCDPCGEAYRQRGYRVKRIEATA